MLRIKALSDSSDENSEDDLERVTKEAEETIIVNEYMRALKLKSQGKKDASLALFQELLEAEAVVKVPREEKETNKLFGVKYNCFRNIGFLYEELGNVEEALRFLVQAIETDDTDIYTLTRVGRLALSIDRPFLARRIFEKCQEINPNHWPSMDGLLDALVDSGSWGAAYGWASHCYQRNPQHKRAIQVLLEVTESYPEALGLLKKLYNTTDFDAGEHVREETRVFKNRVSIDTPENETEIDLESFKVETLDWVSVAKIICDLHKHLIENNQDLTATFRMADFVRLPDLSSQMDFIEGLDDLSPDEPTKEIDEILNLEALDLPMPETPVEAEENRVEEVVELNGNGPSEGNTDSESKAPDPPVDSQIAALKEDNKRRRRGSDLTNLEQWGWHKNRRSKRKKQEDEPEAVDTTMNGFLRRILSSHFVESFIDAPLNVAAPDADGALPFHKNTLEEFREATKLELERFICESCDFDLVTVVSKYCEAIVGLKGLHMPEEVKQAFISVFKLHLSMTDLNAFNLQEEQEQLKYMKMAIFYMELLVGNTEREERHFFEISTVLRFYVGFFLCDDVYVELASRLLWLFACFHMNQNDFESALGYLTSLKDLLEEENPSFSIVLPNLEKYSCYSLGLVRQCIRQTKGKICLRNTKQLYLEEKYADIVEILSESLRHSNELPSNMLVLSVSGQIQLMLESLWCLERLPECVLWMERCLCYTVDEFLKAPIHSPVQKEWAETVNFILQYFEMLSKREEGDMLQHLERFVSRLVQSLTKIVTNQHDVELSKSQQNHLINVRIPWLLLYSIVQREDDLNVAAVRSLPDDMVVLPNAVQLFLTAHDFLGRKKWCSEDDSKFLLLILDTVTPRLRSPELEPARDMVMELLEQVIYCLYKIKPKKQRYKYLGEHNSSTIELTWERAIQLFDIFRPDTLPEFDSYKLLSIPAEMEQVLQKILGKMPECLNISSFTKGIRDFIDGVSDQLPTEMNLLPSRIQSIYYLIADYNFKNRDFLKAIRFYMLDLTLRPQRFDSWAGLVLSKTANIDAKLNSCDDFNPKEFLEKASKVMRCYEQCLKLNDKSRVLWIEYGNFTYNMHSFCSRCLKQGQDFSLEVFEFIEQKKDQCINIAHNAFTTLIKLAESTANQRRQSIDKETGEEAENSEEDEDGDHDEMWLYYYMLGKISEKKREEPETYLNHYLSSAKFLYENGATYPLKILHSYPTKLSIEALEVFYRVNAAIIKYLEQHSQVSRPNMRLFTKVLKDLANSPFAISQAKIKNTTIKRKLAAIDSGNNTKRQKTESPKPVENGVSLTEVQLAPINGIVETGASLECEIPASVIVPNVAQDLVVKESAILSQNGVSRVEELVRSETRRSSHESSRTTTTGTTGSSSSSSSGSSDSSSSSSSDDSEDDSESSANSKKEVTSAEIDAVLKCCIRNFEECITRFPEHYKSTYRLVFHFLNAKGETRSLENCKKLLLSTYTTAMDQKVTGLFTDRKNNNFFNGIWRIPSSEIDRPGNFAAHLSKCTIILIDVLKKIGDYNVLFELSLQLYKTPEADKKYLKETERKELFQQAILFCAQAIRTLLKSHQEAKDDPGILNLLLEIYKIHRKSIKYMQQKESLFSSVLCDVYKAYVEPKAKLPENANVLDLAVRLCGHELNLRKQKEKAEKEASLNPNAAASVPVTPPSTANSPVYIPGVTKRRSVEKKPKVQPLEPARSELAALLATFNTSAASSSSALPQIPNIPLFSANRTDLQVMLALLQQQNLLNSQLTGVLPNSSPSTSASSNYNQFAMKYIEQLAAGLMTMNQQSPPTIKSGKAASTGANLNKNPYKPSTPKTPKAPSTKWNQNLNNVLPFDLPKATSISVEKVSQGAEKLNSFPHFSPKDFTATSPRAQKSLLKPSPKSQASATSSSVNLTTQKQTSPLISVRSDLIKPKSNAPELPIPKFDSAGIIAGGFKSSLGAGKNPTKTDIARPWLMTPKEPQKQVEAPKPKPKKPKVSKSIPGIRPLELPKSLTITPSVMSSASSLPKPPAAHVPKITIAPSKSQQSTSTQVAASSQERANAFLLEYTKNLQLKSHLTIDLTSSSPAKKKCASPAPSKAGPSRANSITNGSIYATMAGIAIPDTISVSPVPSNSSGKSNSPIGYGKSYSPMSTSYRPASISPIFTPDSPSKTLQEKLAEKQKANLGQKEKPVAPNHLLANFKPNLNPQKAPSSSAYPRKQDALKNKKKDDDIVIVLDD